MRIGNSKKRITSGTLDRKYRGLVVAVLAAIVIVVILASYGILVMMERNAHSSAEKLVSEVVDHIDEKLDEVKDVTRDAAKTAQTRINDPEALELLTHDFVEQNPLVYGSTIAFEPDVFPERGRCFAPYSWRTSDGEVHDRQLGTETDYYQEEWYAQTKLSGQEYWCEPYFDEGGAKVMMCTFSVPLKDANGNLTAVMTADVGLEDLEEYISEIKPHPESFIVLRSKKGNALANAEKESDTGNGTIIIKGITEIGWTVELVVPFTYLMRGNISIFLLIGAIFVITILLVYALNQVIIRLQQRSSEEYMKVIDAISTSFSSIHTVDLRTGENYAFRNPGSYNHVIGKNNYDNDFIAKMTKLIEYDTYAPDQEALINENKLETIRKNLEGQDRYDVRFRKLLDGEIHWYEMRVFVLERNNDGEAVRAVVAFADVNESIQKEKENQDALEQALEMAESANRAKTSFLFNMSHDIRTPMNAIIGFTNMALKHIDDKARVTDSLEKMQTAGELLLSLINDILDMSRIESGKIQLDENAGDVLLSFSNIEDTMEELAKAKNISLSFEFGDISDRYVYADFARCIRIFINIITNAIKYTDAGGNVRVRCEQIGRQGENGIYKYTFTDDGIGMSEEFQKRVFDEFTREETTTVSGIQGTGLGLAVCKSFVNAMNGTIECESKQGEGSTFTVVLPFKIQEGETYTNPFTGQVISGELKEAESVQVDFSGRRVLLVEDNELNREIAEDILSEEGMLIESAVDGSVAVKIMNEKGPDYYDFILMDIQMPIMDGYEATRLIREMYPNEKIPIIALSANAFEEDKVKSITAGMNDHVAKPINLDELKTVLARFLS